MYADYSTKSCVIVFAEGVEDLNLYADYSSIATHSSDTPGVEDLNLYAGYSNKVMTAHISKWC